MFACRALSCVRNSGLSSLPAALYDATLRSSYRATQRQITLAAHQRKCVRKSLTRRDLGCKLRVISPARYRAERRPTNPKDVSREYRLTLYMLPNTIRESLRSSLLGTTAEPYFERIVNLVRPAVSFTVCNATPCDDAISRMGGLPDVPTEWEWPVGPEGPLRFLAQVRLDELDGLYAASLLPPDGVLSFFFGPQLYGASNMNDCQIARVFHFASDKLHRATPPENAAVHPDFDLDPDDYWDMPVDNDHYATESFYEDIPSDEQREKIACDLIDAGAASGAMQLLG